MNVQRSHVSTVLAALLLGGLMILLAATPARAAGILQLNGMPTVRSTV
ncbi:hypothetical protein [Horticoccus sp. 23ND18S-11]